MMALNRYGSTDEAEDTTAVRSFCDHPGGTATALRARQGPAAAYGGALRAALTRAHAVASVQLCDEGSRSSPIINGRTIKNALLATFVLTEESRYAG